MPVLNALDAPIEKTEEEPLEREVVDAELQKLLAADPAQMSYDEYLKWYVSLKNIQRFYRTPVIDPLTFIDGFAEEDFDKAAAAGGSQQPQQTSRGSPTPKEKTEKRPPTSSWSSSGVVTATAGGWSSAVPNRATVTNSSWSSSSAAAPVTSTWSSAGVSQRQPSATNGWSSVSSSSVDNGNRPGAGALALHQARSLMPPSCLGNFMKVTCEVFKAKRLSSVSSISTQDSEGYPSWKAVELEKAVTDFNWDIFEFVDGLRDPADVLKTVGMFLFKRVMADLGDEWYSKAMKWLVAVQEACHEVPFHNAIHAADVAIALHHLLQVFEPGLGSLDLIACYCAALAHDVYHPGYSNRFVLAFWESIDPADSHPLETLHAREAVRMLKKSGLAELLGRDRINLVHSMIIATDMQQHNMWVNKAKCLDVLSKEDRLCVMLHAADISNPARSRRVMQKWSIRCMREFWNERDLFLARGSDPPSTLPPRATCNASLASAQVGFSKFFVRPLLVAMLDSGSWVWLKNIDDNIRTRQDVIDAYASSL
ncbi:Calcium/calmodulin-dependent 3',5'-cyclic nucleotide phosphodiesterase 1B [Perkinsus olseni]|uniref:Phosphodiesterase n=1 Tax=Perkinsus olseni TaxID=32597 RepID=A0A7J6LAP2_PEROL|nr:Calcium/calmodulin-dependent 3',5'-cyclic nucleotide phosphodiesterase 1B [Perkinsus olseni]